MQQQQALPANNPPAPATMHTRESKPHPPQTQIAQWVAGPNKAPSSTSSSNSPCPDQLMRTGAFQLFAPRLSFQVPNHQGQAFHPQPSTQAATLRFHKPPSHSFAHPTPTASPTPLRKLEPALGTPPSPPPPLPSITTGTPTPPVTPTTKSTRQSTTPPRRPTITTAPKPTTPAPRNRAVAPCPHNRRRSQCVACFELGHGGGSICIHRRRKAGCRLCAAEGRCHNNNLDGRRRRIRGPNTYVPPPPPPPPPPQVSKMTATKATTAEGGKEREVPPASARTVPGAFSVEALCGQAVSQHHPE
ncbi:hypothetical protein DFJ73DRAFT_950716 [Zopfochytrium polystomum]|nr:hypothetical protein DFJ73DRAFT_930431 [Zopfochytrium polystomum]KAI9337733.1 hypothetical protein DFJ73DRAFT_950716 [Zopfochytrium polystomum]